MRRSSRHSAAAAHAAALSGSRVAEVRNAFTSTNGATSTAAPVDGITSKPSAKVLGKRKEAYPSAEVPAVVPSAAEPPKKRVLPTRSRRTGLGVGSSSIDEMILDAQQRAGEEPFIPRNSVFVLTTDSRNLPPAELDGPPSIMQSSQAPGPSAGPSQPPKLPSYELLSDIDLVPGRLRARSGTEEASDTSDAAYLARHKKYEALERRERRREKEKLVHEQYKLRERIEQLKSMDASAFGGEDKKRAMLEGAEDLDRRYDILLPKEGKGGREKEEAKERETESPREGVGGKRIKSERAESRPPDFGLKVKIKVASNHSAPSISRAASSRAASAAPSTFTASMDPEESLTLRRNPSTGRFMPFPSGKSRGQKPSSSQQPPPVSAWKPSPNPPPVVPFLVQAAMRPGKTDRSTRRPTAFGVPVPAVLDEHREFAIPEWLGVRKGSEFGAVSDEEVTEEEEEVQVDQEL